MTDVERGDRVRLGTAEGTVVHGPFDGVVAIDFGKDGIYNNMARDCVVIPEVAS